MRASERYLVLDFGFNLSQGRGCERRSHTSFLALTPVYNELRSVFVCIATHFLANFIVCKFSVCFCS